MGLLLIFLVDLRIFRKDKKISLTKQDSCKDMSEDQSWTIKKSQYLLPEGFITFSRFTPSLRGWHDFWTVTSLWMLVEKINILFRNVRNIKSSWRIINWISTLPTWAGCGLWNLSSKAKTRRGKTLTSSFYVYITYRFQHMK